MSAMLLRAPVRLYWYSKNETRVPVERLPSLTRLLPTYLFVVTLIHCRNGAAATYRIAHVTADVMNVVAQAYIPSGLEGKSC